MREAREEEEKKNQKSSEIDREKFLNEFQLKSYQVFGQFENRRNTFRRSVSKRGLEVALKLVKKQNYSI